MNESRHRRESLANRDGQSAKPWCGPRRRWLEIVATSALGLLASRQVAGAAAKPLIWRGELLGASTSVTVWHEDRAVADAALLAVAHEVATLESVFSLQRADSALARLNRAGRLAPAPGALLEVLDQCALLHRSSNGAFDPTVQPLWSLFAAHFARPDADPSGPTAAAIDAARARVGFEQVLCEGDAVGFARTGVELTLNGIAQGYVTDRARDVLARYGLSHCLINLGEYRALGMKPSAHAWHVAISHPNLPWRRIATVALEADRALATSAGAGTPFDPRGRFHHLFDPQTGRCANGWRSVTVVAGSAMLADALSTALAVASPARTATILARAPGAGALLLDEDDRLHAMGEAVRTI